MVFNNNKKGAQGIGTLIIFIAMILVAAVAAGVLIQTSSSLQSKALDVGAQSQERVTTTLDVVQVYAEDATNHKLDVTTDTMSAVVRLGAGSDPIKMTKMKIKFSTKDFSDILTFNQTAGSVTQYTSDNSNDYIQQGETVVLSFKMPANVSEAEGIELMFMPEAGSPLPVTFTTPSVMVNKMVQLR